MLRDVVVASAQLPLLVMLTVSFVQDVVAHSSNVGVLTPATAPWVASLYLLVLLVMLRMAWLLLAVLGLGTAFFWS